MSNPAELIASIAHLPIEEQVARVKAHVREIRSPLWAEFMNDPVVRDWIAANAKAINANIKPWWEQ